MHAVAGLGFHIPLAAHTALVLPAGINPGPHLKNISAPSVVLWYASMEPFLGTLGSPQFAGWRNNMFFNQTVGNS